MYLPESFTFFFRGCVIEGYVHSSNSFQLDKFCYLLIYVYRRSMAEPFTRFADVQFTFIVEQEGKSTTGVKLFVINGAFVGFLIECLAASI